MYINYGCATGATGLFISVPQLELSVILTVRREYRRKKLGNRGARGHLLYIKELTVIKDCYLTNY